MSSQRFGGVRAQIAQEAARLMVEEEVKQYFTAKRMAAKRLLGRVEGRRTRYRPADLPSNGEIHEAILQLSQLAEGKSRTKRLFAMRIVALETMRALEDFHPRLIGSVSTGHIRRGSDIDLHVFAESEEPLALHLKKLGWPAERQQVSIHKFGEIREYVHYRLLLAYDVELTLYEPRELRFVPRSSTDGKPIVRLSPKTLEALIAEEHPDQWARYQREGALALDEIEEDSGPHGPWDGLLDSRV